MAEPVDYTALTRYTSAMPKKTMTFAALALVVLSLSACSGSGETPDSPAAEASWHLTEVGDVYCIDNHTYGSNTVTDCNWSTLTDAFTHTDRDAEIEESGWYYFDGYEERVFCIKGRAYGSNRVYDCNYGYEGTEK